MGIVWYLYCNRTEGTETGLGVKEIRMTQSSKNTERVGVNTAVLLRLGTPNCTYAVWK
jgi:hypothetical protein